MKLRHLAYFVKITHNKIAILKQTAMVDKNRLKRKIISFQNMRKVKVTVEKTFRGRKLPNPITIESASYKTDYKLIPKDEESAYCKDVAPPAMKILPKTMEFPPLMKELIMREMKEKGEDVKEPRLTIVYHLDRSNNFKIAEDGETPTVEITCGLGTPISPNLYKGI